MRKGWFRANELASVQVADNGRSETVWNRQGKTRKTVVLLRLGQGAAVAAGVAIAWR